jgi:hypothetical protein
LLHSRLALHSSWPFYTSPCCLCFYHGANSCSTFLLDSLLDILIPPPCVFSFMFLAFCHPKHLPGYPLNASCHLHQHAIDIVQGYGILAKPLTDCCTVSFQWSPQAQEAFDKLKEAICHTNVQKIFICSMSQVFDLSWSKSQKKIGVSTGNRIAKANFYWQGLPKPTKRSMRQRAIGKVNICFRT